MHAYKADLVVKGQLHSANSITTLDMLMKAGCKHDSLPLGMGCSCEHDHSLLVSYSIQQCCRQGSMIAEPKSEKTLARIAAALETSFVFKGIEQSVLQQVCLLVSGLVCKGTSLCKRQGSQKRHTSGLNTMECMQIGLHAQDFDVSIQLHAL